MRRRENLCRLMATDTGRRPPMAKLVVEPVPTGTAFIWLAAALAGGLAFAGYKALSASRH
jgi:hypothetical protein